VPKRVLKFSISLQLLIKNQQKLEEFGKYLRDIAIRYHDLDKLIDKIINVYTSI
jgi:hypothetical protein